MANTHSIDLERGSSQYASIADASQTGLDLSVTGTIECWVKLESNPGTGQLYSIVTKDNLTLRAYGFVYRNISGTYYFDAFEFGGATLDQLRWTKTLTTGVWYHLALTIDVSKPTATTYELYVDGSSQGNGAVINSGNPSSINDTAAPFNIGSQGTTNFFDGLIDDVRVWNDVRTQPEIDDNKSVELVGNEANLVGYWKFNNNANDATSNGNNLTLVNSPIYSVDVPFIGASGGRSSASARLSATRDASSSRISATARSAYA